MLFLKKHKKINNKLIDKFSEEHKISKLIVSLAYMKGVETENDLHHYFFPTINIFHNPYLLRGMSEAVEKIKNAISSKQKILILGDYDTDGICATAIIVSYFKMLDIQVDYFLPNRFTDGYGITIDTLDKIKKLYNPNLIITVDCGIACFTEIEYAKELGFDIIVTDHHEIPKKIPNCICIDCKFNDSYPFKNLCGAGVALKLVHALSNLNTALKFTNICAIATVADIVPLINENRAIVQHGLKYANLLPKGVKKLLESLNITTLTSSDIAFKVAPKLNTAGRMKDASIAFKLFIQDDDIDIKNSLDEISELNDKRIDAVNSIYKDCIEMIKDLDISKFGAIVLYKDNWDGGVLGIVCARLVEKYNKPICLISKVDNEYKGSVRSIEEIDIYKALEYSSEYLIRFGGHKQAGGLSLKEENLENFNKKINEYLQSVYDYSVYLPKRYYDLTEKEFSFNIDDYSELEKLQPFGYGNEKPSCFVNLRNGTFERFKKYPNHIKIKNNKQELVAFNNGDLFENLEHLSEKSAIVEPYLDEYGNSKKIKGKVKDFSFSGVPVKISKEQINANYLETFMKMNYIKLNDLKVKNIVNLENELTEMLKDNYYGTLIICNSIESFIRIKNMKLSGIINYQIFHNYDSAYNTLLLLGNLNLNLYNYNRVILIDEVNNGFIQYLLNFGLKVYVVNTPYDITFMKELSTSREIFGICHKAIQNGIVKNVCGYTKYIYFINLKRINPQITFSYVQFCFMVNVLCELNVLEESFENDNYIIKMNKDIQTDLNNSLFYDYVKKLKGE